MAIDVSYLQELGYSEEELRSYEQSWADGILEYLYDNQTYVLENMRSIQSDFDSDLLLKLPIFYPDAFVLPPTVFQANLEELRFVFPEEWPDIIETQFWGYDGFDSEYMNIKTVRDPVLYQPFLETVGTNQIKKIQKAVLSLCKPSSRIYKFIVMLGKDAGIDISAKDLSEDYLPILEEGKYEVTDNVAFLQQQGLSNSMTEEILTCNPLLLCGTETDLENSLIDAVGEPFPQIMEEMPIEQLEDTLFQI